MTKNICAYFQDLISNDVQTSYADLEKLFEFKISATRRQPHGNRD